MITIEGDEIILSSGKRVYANCAIVGLRLRKSDRSDNETVFGGYDQSIAWPVPEWWTEDEKKSGHYLTDAEMKELAAYMAERWKALADGL